MASTKQAKVVITANASTAKKVLEEIDNLVVKYTHDVNTMRAAGQANSAECKKAERVLQSLAQVQRDNIEDTKRLGQVIQDLTNTKLRDLRRALGSGKSALSALTGSDADMQKADKIRQQMAQAMRQIKLLEGEYVNIGKGIKDVGHQSDQWLDKAIKQQKEYTVTLKNGSVEHARQAQMLRQLEAERDRRNGKQSYGQATHIAKNALNSTWSYEQLKQTQQTLQQHRDSTNDKTARATDIQLLSAVNTRLAELDAKFKAVNIDAQKLQQILAKPQNASINELDHAIEYLNQEMKKLPSGSAEVAKMRKQVATLKDAVKDTAGAMAEMNAKMKSDAQSSLSKVQNGGMVSMSKNDLEASRKAMLDYQNTLVMGGKDWQNYGKAIAQVEERLKSFSSQYKTLQQSYSIAETGKYSDFQGNQRSATLNDLNSAKNVLKERLGNVDASDQKSIDYINKALAQLEERIQAVNGKVKESSIAKMREMSKEWVKALNVMAQPGKFTGEDIKKAMEAIQQRIQKLPAGSKAVADLRAQYSKLEQTLKGTSLSQQQLNDILSRSKQGKASISELKQAYKQLEEQLQHVDYKSKEYYKHTKEMSALKSKIESVTGAISKNGGAWSTALKNLTAYVGLFSVFNQVKDTVVSAIKKNYEYSGSLTDIRKVSGLLEKDIETLSKKLATIDTRTSTEGLAQLAYQGSKLGMGKYGVEGLTEFVKAADQINVAIGEEMGQEALPALSKLVETMGLIPKMGIEKAMLATGSAMFKLSTTSTATSNNIVEMSKRLTGVARTAGITTDQMLALASASDSLFLMPEVSATAFSKFIVALQKNHNLIEKDLGIQEGTIKRMYAAGNAMDAIVMVLEKMRDKGNMNALQGIFKELGSDGQRLVTAMVTMSKNVDVLKDHLYQSQEAFEGASAVTAEYEMQQRSAIGILERANNLWEKAFVNPEGVNSVKSLAEAWYDMSKMMTESPIFKGTLDMALQSLILSAKTLAYSLPALINFFVGAGLARGVMYLWEMGKAIKAAVLAQHALNTAMKANVFGAVASIVLTAAAAIWSYANAGKEAAKAEKEAEERANAWKNRLGEAQQATDTMTKKLDSYKKALNSVYLSQEERNKQISRFNSDFRQYISKLGIEVKSVSDLTKHYTALSKEIERATYFRLREQAKTDALPDLQKQRLQAANDLKITLQNNSSYSGFDVKSVKDMFDRGANAEWIYQQIMLGSNSKLNKNRDKVTFDKNDKNQFTGYWTWDTGNGVRAHGGDTNLLSKLRSYQNATRRETAKSKEIDDYFSAFVPKDYTPWVEDSPGTLENDAPDKDAIKDAKAAALAQQKEWRQQLKEAQSDASAIIDKVKNYYERQILEVTNQANELNLDEAQTDALIKPVRAKMNLALESARKAISNVEQGWDEFKTTMRSDMIEVMGENGINESEMLLEQIEKADLKALQEKIATLSKSLNRPESALMDQIWRNATKNAQANADAERKQREEIQKILLQHQYTAVVDDTTSQQLTKTGAFALDPSQVAILLGGDLEKAQALTDKRAAEIASVLKNAREHIVDLYNTDVSTEQGRDDLMYILFGKNWDQDDSQLKAVFDLYGDDLKAFYQQLLDYSDSYAEAQKKQTDRNRKILTQRWESTGTYKNDQKEQLAVQRQQELYGAQSSFASNLGLTDNINNDPEVSLLRLKMQLAEDYYNFVITHSKDKKLIEEADLARQQSQLDVSKKIAASMKDRIKQLQSLTAPIESFGAAIGDAMAEYSTSAETAEERTKALRKAVLAAVKSMLKSIADELLASLKQQMSQGITNAAIVKQQETEVKLSAKRQLDALIEQEERLHQERLLQIEEEYQQRRRAASQSPSAPSAPADGVPTPSSAPSSASAPSPVKSPSSPVQGGSAAAKPLPPLLDAAPSPQPYKIPTFSDLAQEEQPLWTEQYALEEQVQIDHDIAMEEEAQRHQEAMSQIKSQSSDGSLSSDTDPDESSDPELSFAKKKSSKLESIYKGGWQSLFKAKKKSQSKLLKLDQQSADKETDITSEANAEQLAETITSATKKETVVEGVETGLTALKQSEGAKQLATEQTQNATDLASTTKTETGKTAISATSGVAKAFAQLGPIGGAIAAASIMALITGLLNWALGLIGGGDESSSSTESTKNQKLVSGMLTYDSGNVSKALRGRLSLDSGNSSQVLSGSAASNLPPAEDLKPFLDRQGNLYWAAEDNTSHQGVSLLTQPTATTINGQPSLVAENGPELVIGRETTQAMMQNDPQLLKTLYQYDRNHSGRHAYDQGNLSELASAPSSPASAASATDSVLSDTALTNAALTQAVQALLQRLSEPIQANVNMYGRQGLYESNRKATSFMRGRS